LRTTLQFTADPGSPVARGLSRTYTLANAIFQSAHTNAGRRVQVLVQSTEASEFPSTYWSLVFDSPSDQLLVPGTFSTARPGQTTGHAFEFAGTVGGGCASSTGTITIHEIMGSGGVLRRFHASFTYACTGAGPIVGEVMVAEPAR
jgi:hypothetical protein